MADNYQLPPTEGPTGQPERAETPVPIENVPQPAPPARRPAGDRRWLPLLLIGVGVVLFLANAGAFASIAWSVLVPLGMLAVGLDLITEGRNRRRIATGALIAAPLLVLIVGGANLWSSPSPAAPTDGEVGQPISLDGVDRLRVEVRQTVGNLEIRSLDDDERTVMVDGASQTFGVDGTTGVLSVNTAGFESGNTELLLPSDIPVDLQVDVRIGNADPIDLRDLNLERLRLHVRAGNTELLLPEQGVMDVEVNNNAGNIEVRLPEELQARIQAETSVGQVEVNSDRFQERDDAWYSAGYSAEAPNRAELKLSARAGNIEVK